MSMLDAFFSKGFKGAKCKTLLKLTIPRIKLLRNRREIQIKQMRRDISKLLQTGQEATARIRVEHIVREENMMAAQEIIELYCELIAVRLPIIETQRECPLDLKEAISSVCFAAPRCADLPELQQVQMLFASKYGKEFIAAATELMPDCGVNRQLIELLSVRAPPAEVKLKLLKEIAEEHELDWDPAASETEFFKSHEDLLNGPTQFDSPSKIPLPFEKHDATVYSASAEASNIQSDSDSELDTLDFPEVPKVSVQPMSATSASETFPPQAPLPSEFDYEPTKSSGGNEKILHEAVIQSVSSMPEQVGATPQGSPDSLVSEREDKQFLPFVSSPALSSASVSARHTEQSISISKTKTGVDVDLQDVLAAAHAAAESAERAADAARSAARLAQVRITELIRKRHENASEGSEEVFSTQNLDQSAAGGTPWFDHQKSFNGINSTSYSLDTHPSHGLNLESETPKPSIYEEPKTEVESNSNDNQVLKHESTNHQPQRLTSLEDDPYFSYPNLFTTQEPNPGDGIHSVDKRSF
ncbi:hypothetical protein IFM89_039313 [Coptis chinensis]|uniref:IST1-like protein n=1 Tax=Coptis chinensis TaxID=261450 RepID=A0A835HR65_9MAGN|nr:hypothetical protein IFM89_039313 [Coptis chinensis]